jgi:hypothetical protein
LGIQKFLRWFSLMDCLLGIGLGKYPKFGRLRV